MVLLVLLVTEYVVPCSAHTSTGIIQKKFGKPVTITYKDDERENVIIDGQQALERCWATWQVRACTQQTAHTHMQREACSL
jgi:hypothetical protein